jgi:hypothetical protein
MRFSPAQMYWLGRADNQHPFTVAVFGSGPLPAPVRRLIRRGMLIRVCDARGYQHIRITRTGRKAVYGDGQTLKVESAK